MINYEFPANVDTYVHRIGRTARGGKYGQAITFLPSNFRNNLHFGEFMDVLHRGTAVIPEEFIEENEPDSDSEL